MFRKLIPGLLALLVLSGCSGINEAEFAGDGSCAGVIVAVNFAGYGQDINSCISISGTSATAKDVLKAAGVKTEGTKAFGDLITCRVNQVPGANQTISIAGEQDYVEKCEEIPSALAYWGFYAKTAGSSEWEFAASSPTELEVSEGDSIGFAFAVAGLSTLPTD